MINNFPVKVETLLEKLYRKHRDEFLHLNSIKESSKRRSRKLPDSHLRPYEQKSKKIPELKKLDTRASLGFEGVASVVLQEKRKMADISN